MCSGLVLSLEHIQACGKRVVLCRDALYFPRVIKLGLAGHRP